MFTHVVAVFAVVKPIQKRFPNIWYGMTPKAAAVVEAASTSTKIQHFCVVCFVDKEWYMATNLGFVTTQRTPRTLHLWLMICIQGRAGFMVSTHVTDSCMHIGAENGMAMTPSNATSSHRRRLF